MSRRARRGLVWTAVVGLVAVCYWGMREADSVYDDAHDAFVAIANDPQKVKYVREWVATRTRDPRFMQAVLNYRWFESSSVAKQQHIDIDWRHLGLRPQSAWIAFNLNDTKEPGAEAARIGFVSLNQTRCGVIIQLNPASRLADIEGPPGDPSTIKPVSEGVFVYCDTAD